MGLGRGPWLFQPICFSVRFGTLVKNLKQKKQKLIFASVVGILNVILKPFVSPCSNSLIP